jgi:hypothetical protein
MRSEYPILQAKGIEIIAINVDEYQEKWESTSTTDSIPWTNLYVGADSSIETKYEISGYPKKLTYDQNLAFVNVHLKTFEDILAWANEVN